MARRSAALRALTAIVTNAASASPYSEACSIVVAGSLVAQRAVDDHKVRRRSGRRRSGQQRLRSVIGRHRFQTILLRSGPQRARRPHIRRCQPFVPPIRRHRVGCGSRASLRKVVIGLPFAAAGQCRRLDQGCRLAAHEVGMPFCRRASRNNAAGRNTDGEDGFLLFRSGGMFNAAVQTQRRSDRAKPRRGCGILSRRIQRWRRSDLASSAVPSLALAAPPGQSFAPVAARASSPRRISRRA